MRIIAGEKRGMALKTLKGNDTRPTLDRVKEGMFSAIQFVLPGARVLDLCAGSGQLGFEALSRGAAGCTFVDESREAAKVIRQNAEALGFLPQCGIRTQSAEAFAASSREIFDIILLDPPYKSGVAQKLLPRLSPLCGARAVVLCETASGEEMPPEADGLLLKKQYRYGTVAVHRYEKAET